MEHLQSILSPSYKALQTLITMHFQPVEPMAEDAAHLMEVSHDGHRQEDGESPNNDALDDVFGSSPAAHESTHPSDMRRLETEHTTAGYREGITVAKERSLQAGFDEGFSLGASIGLRAGALLGVLEGVAEAVPGDTELTALLATAREELSPAGVFAAEYWAEDGNWKFEVAGGEGEVVFADVAAAHPLVRKWTGVVDEVVARWKIQRGILDDEGGLRVEEAVGTVAGSAAAAVSSSGKTPLDW